MKTCASFNVSIWVGFRERYTNRVHHIEEVRGWLQKYCNETGFCVSLTETEYIYTHGPTSGCVGHEPGCVVGIINYPRFPSDAAALRERAIVIAKGLLQLLNQGKVTIAFPDETLMLESES